MGYLFFFVFLQFRFAASTMFSQRSEGNMLSARLSLWKIELRNKMIQKRWQIFLVSVQTG